MTIRIRDKDLTRLSGYGGDYSSGVFRLNLMLFHKRYTQRRNLSRKYSRMIDNISRSGSWIVPLSGNTKTSITASNSWVIHPFILIPYLLHNYDVSLYAPQNFSDGRSLAYWEIEISIAIYSRRGIIKAKTGKSGGSHRLLTTRLWR